MDTDEYKTIQEMIEICVRSKEKGIAILLVNRSMDTEVYASSTLDASVIKELFPATYQDQE